jgi:phenylalanyl-tRNA synthetase beta chain
MNISYKWLLDLVPVDVSPSRVGEALTSVGLAVEGIHEHGGDHVLDIDLTSNRPDCLSHLGVARELGAVLGQEVVLPMPNVESAAAPADLVTLRERELCPRFTARIIRNVNVGPSPKWLIDRLEAIGERSINNVADITNYVMHELGPPMHAFDLDKLEGGRIVVRRAAAGEKIRTLDDVERELDTSVLMICDAEKPAAVAGIMGGLESSITEETTSVLLEVAYFDRAAIRAASRKLNLATEASYRFERGVDIDNLERASARAAALIAELCGGEPADFVDVYPEPKPRRLIESSDIVAAVRRLTGLDVSADDCIRILASLGIAEEGSANGTKRTFAAPTWRHDLAIEADLVEEIARHTGLDRIVAELPPAIGAGEYQPGENRERRLRGTLVANGFSEAISYSFIDTKYDDAIDPVPGVVERSDESFVTLQDSIIEGAVRMRASALPGMLEAVRVNLNQQRRDQKLFEIGRVFAAGSNDEGLPNEQKVLAIVLTGNELDAGRSAAVRVLDFYDLKGSIEAAFETADVTNVEVRAENARHLKEGQSAAIYVAGTKVGWIGTLADGVAASFKYKQPVYVGEVNLSAVLSAPRRQAVYRPLAKYPGVMRDISFVVDRKTEFAAIKSAIDGLGVELLRSVEFVDVYEGAGMNAGEKSITIRLEYRSDERTLVEDEVEELNRKVVDAVENSVGAKVRFG